MDKLQYDITKKNQIKFSQKRTKIRAQARTKNFKNGLRTSVLLGVISDNHLVHTKLEDPVDVIIELQFRL